jgi:glycosyltransferase involved in cell wall biosynthesis
LTSYLASRTGVGVCVGGLVRALQEEAQDLEDWRFKLCALSLRRHVVSELRDSFALGSPEVRHLPIPVRVAVPLADRFPALRMESFFGDADVFHAGSLWVPASRRAAVVVTLFDLTPIRFPKYHLASNLFTVDQLKRRLGRAKAVIVPSKSTAAGLRSYSLVEEEKIRVIPLGLNPVFRPMKGCRDLLRRFGLGGEFILTVGSIEPRKNLALLLQAFSLLKERHHIPHKLAIAGPQGWMQEDLPRVISELKLDNEVVFTGFVPDEILNVLYNETTLLVYPSMHEGFGLPPLEAMAAGCPVAVSRVSSLPEVVGEAGRYFDPLEVEEIARTVLTVLESNDLRLRLSELGRRRSGEFSWKKAARATFALYKELLGLETR